MQAVPDYVETLSIAEFGSRFPGLNYSGPGFYLTATDTILVIPRREMPKNISELQAPEISATEIWRVRQPEGIVLEVLVYNCKYNQTIWSVAAVVPTRHDTRVA